MASHVLRAGIGAAFTTIQLSRHQRELQTQTITGNLSSRNCKENVSDTQSTRGTCVVVGSGIVGLTTAYYLAIIGRYDKIHVIDQHEACSHGASFQNGGVINVEAIAPANSYMDIFGVLKRSLLHTFTGADTNTVVSWRAMMEPPGLMLRWLWFFFQSKSEESIQLNSRKMLELGCATGPLFKELVDNLNLDAPAHNFTQTPGLLLFHAADPDAAVAKKHERFGAVKRKLYVTCQELADIKNSSGLQGLDEFDYNVGCVEPDNLTVNTRTLCRSLQDYLASRGVEFHYSCAVTQIVTQGNRATSLILASGLCLESDSIVLCAGYETCYLLRSLGISLPLAPVKAYSLHIENVSSASSLRYAAHLSASCDCLVTPYRDGNLPSVRVTGIRDMDGFNSIMRADRVDALMKSACKFVGDDFDTEHDVSCWAGVMAVSPDDLPIVGGLQKYENMYVNTGHGFRGTNWSVATAKLLAQLMLGDCETCVDKELASPCRFGV